mmetsp:Transcript_55447/g.120873  ORF Transcript_55447/g.120873 Transcript_55447/m.120873 type:complete len:328 (-) Transcript_55447:80-1063(-)
MAPRLPCAPLGVSEEPPASATGSEKVHSAPRLASVEAAAEAAAEESLDTLDALLQECMCPISRSLLRDPVMAADGHTYEREAIIRWLTRHNTSPMTGLPVPNRIIVPNMMARKMARILREAGVAGAVWDSIDNISSEAALEDAVCTLEPEEVELCPRLIFSAVRRGDSPTCLSLLSMPDPPGMNTQIEFGWTVLHWAAEKLLEDVCLAIVARPDYTLINSMTPMGFTALHFAAKAGLTQVCCAIIARPDFEEVDARLSPDVLRAFFNTMRHSEDATVEGTPTRGTALEIAECLGHRRCALAMREACRPDTPAEEALHQGGPPNSRRP